MISVARFVRNESTGGSGIVLVATSANMVIPFRVELVLLAFILLKWDGTRRWERVRFRDVEKKRGGGVRELVML